MLWAILITYGLIGCLDRRFVTFPVGLVLGCEDDHETMEDDHETTEASEWDQNRILARDQNHENACAVRVTWDQNNKKARDASVARDQNNENDYEGNSHFGETNEKQMTYREALLGLDNSELSSDF